MKKSLTFEVQGLGEAVCSFVGPVWSLLAILDMMDKQGMIDHV